jgi:hypothetical protein
MTSPIDSLRDLAVKNAKLREQASRVQQSLHTAAEKESARLSQLIDGVSHADVLTSDDRAEVYQAWVVQRAGLLRLLAQNVQSAESDNRLSRS